MAIPLLIGGNGDNNGQGAAWVFTRNGGVWTQQGAKLVGSGGTATASQGEAVALSADGNTVVLGGPSDNSSRGAVWIFNRFGTSWLQYGAKLIGSGNTGSASLGNSVAISADGNTIIAGGESDNSAQGAAWIFVRNGNSWLQQGSKLVGTGGTGRTVQGLSVAINADGNTIIMGGPGDNTNQGAVWVFTRTGTTWAQQGQKLAGTGI
jgi:hydroxyethylthiazole kinase-like sugar kinase family protein